MVKAAADVLVKRLTSKIGASAEQQTQQSHEALKAQGSEHYKAGRFTIAGSFYRSAISANPHYADAHNNLGAVLRRRGRPQSAIASFQTALMLNPRSGLTYGNLANLHERYGNIAQAETLYLKAVERDPSIFQAFLGLARIAAHRQRWDDALAALTRAASIAPHSAEIHYQTGVVNLSRGEFKEALNCLRNAETKAQDNADIKASLAEALYALELNDQADEKLAQCLSLDPENAIGLDVSRRHGGGDTSTAKTP